MTFSDECRIVVFPPKKGKEGGHCVLESKSPPAIEDFHTVSVAKYLSDLAYHIEKLSEDDIKKCAGMIDNESSGIVHMFIHKLMQVM